MPRRSRYRLVTRSWSIDDCSVGMVTKLEVAVDGDCGSEYRYMNGPTRRASSTSICARVGDEGSGVCGPGDGGGGEARSRTMGMSGSAGDQPVGALVGVVGRVHDVVVE